MKWGTKASRIYYEAAANLLTSASDYAELGAALRQACNNLVGTGGITAADCVEVNDAVTAVEMDQTPPAAPNPEAPVCPPGEAASDLYFDDLENPASGNWARQTAAGTNNWFHPQNANPYGFDATFATSGSTNFWGYDQAATADYSIAMTSSVALPAASNAYLRFDHAFGFEDDAGGAYDGGVLEYSTNNGTSWHDAGSLSSVNGYTGTISNAFDNPLGGRSGFVRESNGYISSRFALGSLGGQSVRFRFRIGTDFAVDDYGWFVDDVNIYTCATEDDTEPPETSITSGPSGEVTDTDATFEFSSSEPGSTFECRLDSGTFAPCSSPKSYTALDLGSHTFRVRAIDPA
ncbi:MAG: hypothetical protein ACRDJL_06365 [Actinomycetota bacterium]